MEKAQVIEAEQRYFDVAYDERERGLSELDLGAANAANSKAAADLRALAKSKRAEVDPEAPMAEVRMDTDDGETLYIGKHHVTTADRDVLVVSWKARVADRFYQASVTDPHGVSCKRTFSTERNRVLDFDDVVFADLLERVQALDGEPEPFFEDALLRDLNRSRTGEMQDIVKTIQAAQHDLIRAPLDRLLIVQGGPGTGKTAIALHRVSWLLYNYDDQLRGREVLVVGPNPTFARYIRALLPALGDVDVAQTSLSNLGPLRSHRRSESLGVTALKGDPRMAGLVARALTARVRTPEDPEGTFEVATRAGAIRIPNAQLEQALADARTAAPTYSTGRGQVRTWLAETLAALTTGTVGATAQQVDAALDRVWPSLTPAAFLRELFGSRDRLFEAAGHDFSAEEATRLYRQSADRVSEETWADADIALLDEADSLINGEPTRFLHVVVDEAQDLSPMQLRSLRRRSNGSMTVVGDLAQSTGAWARQSWTEVAEALDQSLEIDVQELAYGYRVPRQVMDLAARLLPLAAPGISAPRVVRDGPSDPTLIDAAVVDHAELAVRAAREYAGRGLSVGIVCPDESRHLVLEELTRQDVQWNDSTSGSLGQGINLISATDAKGLEFDSVVVVSPHVIVEEDVNGHRLLYIALTRTTRYLTVVHDGDPLALNRSVPGADRDELDGTLARQPSLPMEGSPAVAEQLAIPDQPPVASPTELAPKREPASARSAALKAAVLSTAAMTLAEDVRSSVPTAMWPELIDQLRRELGVSSDDVLDLLD